MEHPLFPLPRHPSTKVVVNGHEGPIQELRGVLVACWKKRSKEAKQKHLHVAEWPVILQGWRWAGKEVDGREDGGGSSGLTWSSHDHFDRKEYSWCYTKKYIDNIKLIQEGNVILQKRCALCEQG